MRAWWVVVVVGSLLSSCAAHRFECEKHGGSAVVRVDTEHFSVSSDLPPADVRFEARRLERLWDAFAVFFNHAPETGERLSVVLSHDEVASEFIPDTSGFVTGGLSPLMVTSVTRGHSNVAHELVHVMSRHWLRNQPRWLAEGLARYLGDATFVSETTLRFGRWQWGGGRVEPMVTLWAWDKVAATPDEEREHYESAWAWLHYLVNRESARLEKLWAALSSGQPPRDAFESVFPPAEYDGLGEQVQRYVDEGRFSGWESKLLRDPEVAEPVAVSPWEVHLLRRELLLTTGWGVRGRAESGIAREVSPQPEPWEVTLAVAIDTLMGPERTDIVLKLASTKGRPLAHLEFGVAVDASPYGKLSSLKWVVTELPNSARAHLALARVALRVGDVGALPAAQRAVQLAPWSVEARLAEALALAKASRCPDAQSAITTARGLAVERESDEAPEVAAVSKQVDASCAEAP